MTSTTLIERLRVIAQWLDQRAHFESEPETKASHSEDADTCLQAAAALEAAREDGNDAARYRWLRDSPNRPCRVPCAYAVMPGDVEYPTPLGGGTLDAAIDQARGKGIVPEQGEWE